ncbi:hypothetical protein LPJ61_000590 [Coemansia biformis]|uniref:Uncharacterized protein n=1 Tax=Coemansia biformis TaxID=1286918 RepID=A0A9W7YGF1_9FUNG|nr:hypothetical protein LPJ61_000590 [Coemansia biformis]
MSQQQLGSHAVDAQQHGVGVLLQSIERLEAAGDKFFDSLAMVGQGPPSLLAAQLVSMSQLCHQMHSDAEGALLLSVPVAMADPVFVAAPAALLRSEAGVHAALASSADLDSWAQDTATQTSQLFAERGRIAANVQAPLSVPPPRQLSLS